MTTLYSPNLGADSVAEDVCKALGREASRFSGLEIAVLEGDAERREAVARRLRLAPLANLFMVERIRMPSPSNDGKTVAVYRTTMRVGKQAYVTTYYTTWTQPTNSGIVDLTEEEMKKITWHVGAANAAGVWQSLLQVKK